MKDKFDIDFDVRVVERNIKDNKITAKDYDQYLEDLDDLTDQAEPLVIEDEQDEQEQDEDLGSSDSDEVAEEQEGES